MHVPCSKAVLSKLAQFGLVVTYHNGYQCKGFPRHAIAPLSDVFLAANREVPQLSRSCPCPRGWSSLYIGNVKVLVYVREQASQSERVEKWVPVVSFPGPTSEASLVTTSAQK